MNENDTPVRAALHAWAAAFNECDVDNLVVLYSPEALLWGTVSPVPIAGAAGIRDYFERTCSTRPPPRVVLGELLVRSQHGTAVSAGTYTFTLTLQGLSHTLPARFSFAYRKVGLNWLVTSHHSSLMPPAASGAPSAGR